MWTGLWSYKESILLSSTLFVLGTLLSYVLDLKVDPMTWPYNLFSGIILICFIVCTRVFFSHSTFFTWISGKKNAVIAIAAYLIVVILLGLIPQQINYVEGPLFRMGFSHLLSSHQFLFIQIYLMVSLGMVLSRRFSLLHIRGISFTLNHLGLWIIFFAVGLGAGDIEKYKMEVYKNTPEFRGVDTEGNVHGDLGIALQLEEFTIDYYPPKAYVIDANTGHLIYDKDFAELVLGTTSTIGQWEVHVDSVLSHAIELNGNIMAFNNRGSAPAAHVSVYNIQTKDTVQGWISCGSYIYKPHSLTLNEDYLFIMSDPEAKTYQSQLKVYAQSGDIIHAPLTVGHPIHIDHWRIYQTSYDTEKGSWSDYSIVEIVHDPWIKLVYLGFFMLIAGSLLMIFRGKGGHHVS